MKTRRETEAFIDEYVDNDWLYMMNTETDEFIRITQDNIGEAAKHYKVPEAFLEMLDDALRTMGNEIIGALHMDLEDIWNKVSKD
jgi:hypothetical protein